LQPGNSPGGQPQGSGHPPPVAGLRN
jgi:hypothetical protein